MMHRSRIPTLLAPRGTAPGFDPPTFDFDGTNDYFVRGAAFSSAPASSQSLILAMTILPANTAGGIIFTAGNGTNNWLEIYLNFGPLSVIGRNQSGRTVFSLRSTNNISTSGVSNILVSASSSARLMYINDVQETLADNGFFGTRNVEWVNHDNFKVGARMDNNNKYNGHLRRPYLNIEESIDFTVEANRRKFFDAAGNPVDLGPTGAGPTGNQPAYYATDDLAVNRGYGGNLTAVGEVEAV